MRTLPAIINHAMPGYFPENCTVALYTELQHERPALRAAMRRINDSIRNTAAHPSGAVLRQAIKDEGFVEVFHKAVEEYLKQDMEGFIAREAGLKVHPSFAGDLYAEFCEWKEANAKIEHLDFQPAS